MNKHTPTPWFKGPTGNLPSTVLEHLNWNTETLWSETEPNTRIGFIVMGAPDNVAHILECVNGYGALKAERDRFRSIVEAIAEMAGDGTAATMCRAALKLEGM